MPPWRQWYTGREAIRSFFAVAWKTCGGLRLVATAANGQPAFAVYELSGDGQWDHNPAMGPCFLVGGFLVGEYLLLEHEHFLVVPGSRHHPQGVAYHA